MAKDKKSQKAKKKWSFIRFLTEIFIRFSLPLVIAASIVLLAFIFLLSMVLPRNEKEALIRKTDDFCIATAIGLSSVTIEAVTGNKRAVINDYLNGIRSQHIRGLNFAEVIEFKRENSAGNAKEKEIAGGTIIASLDFHDVGKEVPPEKLASLAQSKSFEKQVITNNTEVFYEYTYPIIWKVKYKGNDLLISIGALQLRFSERDILENYYQYRKVSNWITFAASISGIVIVFFYLILVRILKDKIAEIHEMSITDALTRIYNRKKFNESLEMEIRRTKRYGGVLSVIMFDIDHFKLINDKFGHDAGDMVLVSMAEIVCRAVRTTDLFARWGGEEFMVLTPGTGQKETADFAERIRMDIEAHSFKPVGSVTSSFGVAAFNEYDTVESFLKRVDNALYKAKESGRNKVVMG